MTQHDPQIAIGHMRDHANEAIHLASDITREDLEKNRVLVLALTRLVEIIGEAATRVPANVRANLPKVPWSDVISTRNRLIHGYDKVDLDILWTIVKKDLPALVAALN